MTHLAAHPKLLERMLHLAPDMHLAVASEGLVAVAQLCSPYSVQTLLHAPLHATHLSSAALVQWLRPNRQSVAYPYSLQCFAQRGAARTAQLLTAVPSELACEPRLQKSA